jgi:hypothetical protein
MLTGQVLITAYQSVLQAVTFESTSTDPTSSGTDPTRTVSFSVNDGTNASAPVYTTVEIDGLGLDTESVITKAQADAIAAAGYGFIVFYIGNHVGHLTAATISRKRRAQSWPPLFSSVAHSSSSRNARAKNAPRAACRVHYADLRERGRLRDRSGVTKNRR